MITNFTSIDGKILSQIPKVLPSPFNYSPHPVAQIAAEHLMDRLSKRNDLSLETSGQMFGVLLVKDTSGNVGYLSSFAGKLNGNWDLEGFVPPVFSVHELNSFIHEFEKQSSQLTKEIQNANNHQKRLELTNNRTQLVKEFEEKKQALLLELNEKKIARQKKRELLSRSNLARSDLDEMLYQLGQESWTDKNQKKQFLHAYSEKLNEVDTLLYEFIQQDKSLYAKKKDIEIKWNKQQLDLYELCNFAGEREKISRLFQNKDVPPDAGNCSAPKLFQFAAINNLTPLAFTQFWWGKSPDDDIRHHKKFYPACRGRCLPIMAFMLKGLEIADYERPGCADKPLDILYEDEYLIVVNKPAGLLSVPGKEEQDSVQVRLNQSYPQEYPPLLLHRLDMMTSGIIMAAKDPKTHKALQKQFMKRIIKKSYVALLSRQILPGEFNMKNGQGEITLPIAVNHYDRPRQMVCAENGRSAITNWEIIASENEKSRVRFYPITGRTHQLRIHAAHSHGLNAPIIGDKLYGNEDNRLYLHAETLQFIHPATGETQEIISRVPF